MSDTVIILRREVATITGNISGEVVNFSALPVATTVPNQYWRTLNPETTGTWIQNLVGAGRKPEGIYQSVAGAWDYVGEFPYEASQVEVDAGTETTKFVTPKTLKDANQWSTKADTSHTHSTSDIADFQEGVEDLIGTKIIAGTNINVTYDDLTGETTIDSTGGSGTLIAGTAILNFGLEENKAITTISNALVTTANIKSISFIHVDTLETSLDDFTLNGVSFKLENIIDNTSFDIRGGAINDASGNYTINYIITI